VRLITPARRMRAAHHARTQDACGSSRPHAGCVRLITPARRMRTAHHARTQDACGSSRPHAGCVRLITPARRMRAYPKSRWQDSNLHLLAPKASGLPLPYTRKKNEWSWRDSNPQFPVCKTGAVPVWLQPHRSKSERWDSNPRQLVCRTSVLAAELRSEENLAGRRGFEPRSVESESTILPVRRSPNFQPGRRWDSNPQPVAYEATAANPVELRRHSQSERWDSNPLPPVWKTGARPVALRSHVAATRCDETYSPRCWRNRIPDDVVPSAFAAFTVRMAGFEPATSCARGTRSSRLSYILKSGWESGTRTRADRLNRPALCQLSYLPTNSNNKPIAVSGIEPPSYGYRPVMNRMLSPAPATPPGNGSERTRTFNLRFKRPALSPVELLIQQLAGPKGFEPSFSALTALRPLQTGPRPPKS
jgi:hypothetical protein